jgi:hypothetical protein
MRCFLKQFGLFVAIQLAIAAVIVWSYRRQFPAAQNFLAASIDKQSLIRTQASPRLIFIGGSSMAFGVHSAEIAKACGRQPVNMGLHAALGLKFMLNQVAPHIRQNDWIIVAPEYQQFVRMAGQSEMLVNMLEIDPSNVRLLDAPQWAAAFDVGFIQRFGKISRAVLGRPGRFFRKNTMSASTRLYYRRKGFDQNGDVVAHLTEQPRGLREKEFRFRYRDELVQEAIGQVNRFAKAAEARGAKVFFSHPPLPREVFVQNRPMLDRLEAELKAKLIVPQLDSAEELVFPVGDFFDTWYHLAATGVDKRTELLASRVAQLAKTSAQVSVTP